MPESTSDEDWVAGLRDLARDAAPAVPVDVSGAVRRGRRRRAVRRAATGGGALLAGCAVVAVGLAAVPSLLGGLGSSSDDSGSASMADAGDVAGGQSAASSVDLSVEDLAAAVADGSIAFDGATSDGAVPAPEAGGTVEPLVVVQVGTPDPDAYLRALGAAVDVRGVLSTPRDVTAAQWPDAMTRCLDGAGWDVTAEGDGWRAEVQPHDARSFLADVGTCAGGLSVR